LFKNSSQFPQILIGLEMGIRCDSYLLLFVCAHSCALVIFLLYTGTYGLPHLYMNRDDRIFFTFPYTLYPPMLPIAIISIQHYAHTCSSMAKCRVTSNHSNRNSVLKWVLKPKLNFYKIIIIYIIIIKFC